jgi:hypothetical protein
MLEALALTDGQDLPASEKTARGLREIAADDEENNGTSDGPRPTRQRGA